MICDKNLWLFRQCPLLHHIILNETSEFGDEISELKKFFELNSEIQIFSTTFDFLWNNRDFFFESNIKIDRLDVTGVCFNIHITEQACTVLNQLYDQGFYKRVHMYPMLISNREEINHISSVRGMEKLYIPLLSIEMTLPPMSDLRELDICKLHFRNVEINNVKNLLKFRTSLF